MMSDLWADSVLRPAAPDIQRDGSPVAEPLEAGGPIAVLVEPNRELPYSAAFYDEELTTLTVHILPFDPYYSFLESGETRIDTDEHGRPVFIEVAGPMADWQVDPQLSVPMEQGEAALIFRETRRRFSRGRVLTDARRQTVCVRFLARQGTEVHRLADNLLAETADGFLVALWVVGVRWDFGERKQSRWRAAVAARLRQSGHRWRCCSGQGVAESQPVKRNRQFSP